MRVRRHARQRGDLAPVQVPQFRQHPDQPGPADRPNARHRAATVPPAPANAGSASRSSAIRVANATICVSHQAIISSQNPTISAVGALLAWFWFITRIFTTCSRRRIRATTRRWAGEWTGVASGCSLAP